jgi:hypothetical protein
MLLALASPALADDWFPHPANATWQYKWSDTVYNPSGTVENVVVQQQVGKSFTLAWADSSNQPPPAGTTSINCPLFADIGTMAFQDTNSGLINTDWNSCPPPPQMPILCATTTNCANSLASTLYLLIWGNRVPVLSEPLLQGVTWDTTGGAQNDVSSSSRYLGLQTVTVPAFPNGVTAGVVRTNIAQAGAIGDPYGSGVRTVWWVRGVGPVKIVFDHAGGSDAPVTTAYLQSTNLKPETPLPDANYFPLELGLKGTYRWTNSKHLPKPEIENVVIDAAVNRTARISVKSVSGPLRAVGAYGFTARLDGISNLWGSTSAATLTKFPPLGHKRHLFTPIDFITFGFGPLLPAYPKPGDSWKSDSARDFSVYGVTGTTKVIGVRRVHVPAGTFHALEIRSVLVQAGYPYGSGVRTMWLAPGRGLVKLIFKHRDGSTSVVELIRNRK